MQPVESRLPRSRQPDRRSALLGALRAAAGSLSVGEVAAAVGIAESTAQFHLSLLVSAGLAERTSSRSGSAGRPSWRYTAAPATPPIAAPDVAPPPAPPVPTGSPGAYQELARVLAAQLGGGDDVAATAREAGRRWAEAVPTGAARPSGDASEAVASLTRVLDELGFAPERSPDAREIVLHACPFEAVAREHQAVVCGVHLGLLEHTAEAIGSGLLVERLEPFRSQQPLACAVQLGLPRSPRSHPNREGVP